MRIRFLAAVSAALFAGAAVPALGAQPASSFAPAEASGSLQSSNLFNPNISAIGWIQAEAGRRVVAPGEEVPSAAELKEVEIAFQSVIDPYTRADIFVALEGEGHVALEEGYLTWFALPHGLSARAGRMKANVGRFNRMHTPETPFADRPLVHDAMFGEEGLSGAGASLSWQVPVPWFFIEVTGDALTAPEEGETPAFSRGKKKDLVYAGRINGYQDLGEALNVSLGASAALGSAGEFFDDVAGSSSTLRSRVAGADVTFRWKNPRRAIYRSALWQTEFFRTRRESTPSEAVHADGWFSHVELQFARRWRAGGRIDWTEHPEAAGGHDRGGLVYLTFTPSEFTLLSLQGRQVELAGGETERIGFLKTTFSMGPHGSHPF